MTDNTCWFSSLKVRTQEVMQLCIRMHLTAVRECSWGQWFGVRKWPSALHITRRAGITGMTAAIIQTKKPLYVCTLIGQSHGTSKLLKEADSVITRQWKYQNMVWASGSPFTGCTYHMTTQLIHRFYPGWDKPNMPEVMHNEMPASGISWDQYLVLNGAKISFLWLMFDFTEDYSIKPCAGKLHMGSHLSLWLILNWFQPSQTAALHFHTSGTSVIANQQTIHFHCLEREKRYLKRNYVTATKLDLFSHVEFICSVFGGIWQQKNPKDLQC